MYPQKKKPADQDGLNTTAKATEYSITRYGDIVNKSLPDWAIRKIVLLSKDRQKLHESESLKDALLTLESDAINGLIDELATLPALGELVPQEFATLLRRGAIMELSDFEKGTAILIDADAKAALPAIDLSKDMETFLTLKWECLGALLAGGFHD